MKPTAFAVLSLVMAVFLVAAAGQSATTLAVDEPTIGPAEFSCANVTEIPQVECEALVALYDSTDGPGWKVNTGWKVTNTPCSWHGIGCERGHVTRLGLASNFLNGAIPPELGNLAGLSVLSLFSNQLSGAIPSQLGNLTSLYDLSLFGNQLNGAIPPELGNLANLLFLALGSNQLSGAIPPQLGNLTSVNSLNLGSNQLSGAIPPEFGNLRLAWLNLSANQLSGTIPLELGNVTTLLGLYLNDNQLSGAIPAELGQLTNLVELYLNGNRLSGALPQRLTNLHLYSFHFDNTSLCEPPNAAFQGWLAGIQDLRRTGILCDDCAKITEVPKVECEALVALYYNANGEGWINASGWSVTATPCSWYGVACDTGHVVALSLPSNQLRGTIPPQLSDLAKLQDLILASNALSGTLPYGLTALNLKRFWFDGTALCEPSNATFQSWLAGIGDLRRTGVLCKMWYLPIVRCCAPWPGRPTMGMLHLQR